MRFACLFIIVWIAWSTPSFAQAKNLQSLINQFIRTDTTVEAPPSASDQLTWMRGQLKASEEQLQTLNNEGAPADLIAQAELIVRQQTFSQSTLEGVVRLEKELNDLKEKPMPAPPANQKELAAAKRKVADLKSQLGASDAEQVLMAPRLSEAEAAVKTGEAAVIDAALSPAQKRLAELQLAANQAALFNLKWRQYQENLHAQLNDAHLQQLERSIEISGLDVQLNPKRAEQALATLATDRTDISEQILKVQKIAEGLNQQLNGLDERGKTEALSAADKSQMAILSSSLAMTNQLTAGLETTLQLIDLEEKHWQTVQTLSTRKDLVLLQKTRGELQQEMAWILQSKSPLVQRLQDTSRTLENLTTRVDAAWRDKSLKPLLEKQQSIVSDRVTILRSLLQRIEQVESYQGQLVTEIEVKLLEESSWEKFMALLSATRTQLVAAWNYPLPIQNLTLGKLVLGILALIVAFSLASLLSKRAASIASRRFPADPTKAVLMEKWVYFATLILFVLTVLNWLSIPLTVFAFLGGALAIGIGFGGQNLMNNFISGLILLFERQVNVGDIVEVDGHTGKVVHLGTRSSCIRKFDGVDVLVPNSYFLEKNVINWTLSDPYHRYDFVVGVSYGSPVERCLVLFKHLLESHPLVQKDPEPFVFFENFGDNSLNFRFYYWLPVGVPSVNSGQVGSDLRVRIDAACREAGIEIAFPQRDVHLSASKPLEIRLSPEQNL